MDTLDEATAVGTCLGCGQSIFDDEQWENDDDQPVPGMWHAECLDA